MITMILFAVGFVLLFFGGSFLVDGSASLAKKLRISNIVIGLTIVAFGTSAPELIVNIMASLNGNSDIAVGNIVGSNIANILLILGIAAVIYPLTVQKNTTWKEMPLMLLALIALGFMVNDGFFDGMAFNILTKSEGFVLLLFFAIFMYYTFGISKAQGDGGEDVKIFSVFKSIMMIIVGLVALTFGGKFVVDGAVFVAKYFGLSEALIGLTIVAVGTSLPELFTSAVAAYKKQSDIAIGNIVGSNIFNVFWILGVSAIIQPVNFSLILNMDLILTIGATLLLFAFMFIGKKHKLERWQGVMFIMLYVVYIGYLIMRG